jgi:hypothetical protein
VVYIAKNLRAGVGIVHLGNTLANQLYGHACRLRTTATPARTIRDTKHGSRTVVDDKSTILVLRMSGGREQNWFH